MSLKKTELIEAMNLLKRICRLARTMSPCTEHSVPTELIKEAEIMVENYNNIRGSSK